MYTPLTTLLCSKTVVYGGTHNFLIFGPSFADIRVSKFPQGTMVNGL